MTGAAWLTSPEGPPRRPARAGDVVEALECGRGHQAFVRDDFVAGWQCVCNSTVVRVLGRRYRIGEGLELVEDLLSDHRGRWPVCSRNDPVARTEEDALGLDAPPAESVSTPAAGGNVVPVDALLTPRALAGERDPSRRVLVLVEPATRMLTRATAVAEVNEIRGQAAAIERYAPQYPPVEDRDRARARRVQDALRAAAIGMKPMPTRQELLDLANELEPRRESTTPVDAS